MSKLMIKRAFITGASGAIGSELARALASDGVPLILAGLQSDPIEKLESELAGKVEVKTFFSDLNDVQEFRSQLKVLWDEFPDIDFVIGNAGIDEPGEATKDQGDSARRHMEINFMANVVLVTFFLPRFEKNGYGSLGFVSSQAALMGFPLESSYCASKAALSTYLEAARAEIQTKNVSISVIHPGFIDSPMAEGSSFVTKSMLSTKVAAEKILKAMYQRKKEVFFPKTSYIQLRLSRFLPVSLREALAKDVTSKTKTR